MHPQNEAILKSLVSVAWSDGDFGASEREMLDALLVAFEASEEQAADIRKYAEQKRGLEDIPVEDLSADDLRILVHHAVLLTFIDGTQDANEKSFVEKMALHIGIPQAEVGPLIAAAEERAKRNLAKL